MIGAGIFALTGQIAALTGDLMPIALICAAIVVGFSAYSYVKLSNDSPSSGGIASYLEKEYGPGLTTGVFALFMYISMVINESLVARTFGSYVLQPFTSDPAAFLVPALGVGLIVIATLVNIASNRLIERTEGAMAVFKIAALLVFAGAGLWFMDTANLTSGGAAGWPIGTVEGFLAAVGLSVLAYKGFTTITNSGGEIKDPHRNTSRAIVISLAICAVLYLLISLAVAGNLSVDEIIAAQDYSLAKAAEPGLGQLGVNLTVAIAVVATASGVIASIFAVSRMLAMLSKMELVPYGTLGIPGSVRFHTTLFTAGVAIILTIAFDLQRIAALGAIFYLTMDIAIHWGLLRKLRSELDFNRAIVVGAILLDAVVLGAFLLVKASDDPFILYVAAASITLIVLAEWLYIRSRKSRNQAGGEVH
jgi:amino acid transporter